MTTCDDCDANVRFILLKPKGEPGCWSLPLDTVSQELVEWPGGYTRVENFIIHGCPERVARDEMEFKAVALREASARNTDEAWVVALKNQCDKCHAPRAVKCVNMSDVNNGAKVRAVRWPHAERLPNGWFAQYMGWQQ